MTAMEIVFLGTNGWYDTLAGNTICILIRSRHHDILLDAGDGIHKLDRFIEEGPVHLFLSHFHLDHISGLHILNKFHLSEGLHIYGQPGTRRTLDAIVNRPFTVPLKELPYPVDVAELEPGLHEQPFPLECRFLEHTSPCLGYRFHLDDRIIAYCPDTGLCENAVSLARGADLLIAECSLRPGETSPEWPHLNPEDAVSLARKAGAKKLALVHFDASRYPTVEDRLDAASSVNYPGLIVALDDMAIDM